MKSTCIFSAEHFNFSTFSLLHVDGHRRTRNQTNLPVLFHETLDGVWIATALGHRAAAASRQVTRLDLWAEC